MPSETALAAPEPPMAGRPDELAVVPRIKFDRWLFDRDIDNIAAARLFNCAPLSIGRWRKRFDDPGRRPPPSEKIAEIERLTGGEVGLQDWFRPCPVAYVDSAAPPATDRHSAGAAQ